MLRVTQAIGRRVCVARLSRTVVRDDGTVRTGTINFIGAYAERLHNLEPWRLPRTHNTTRVAVGPHVRGGGKPNTTQLATRTSTDVPAGPPANRPSPRPAAPRQQQPNCSAQRTLHALRSHQDSSPCCSAHHPETRPSPRARQRLRPPAVRVETREAAPVLLHLVSSMIGTTGTVNPSRNS